MKVLLDRLACMYVLDGDFGSLVVWRAHIGSELLDRTQIMQNMVLKLAMLGMKRDKNSSNE